MVRANAEKRAAKAERREANNKRAAAMNYPGWCSAKGKRANVKEVA